MNRSSRLHSLLLFTLTRFLPLLRVCVCLSLSLLLLRELLLLALDL